MTAFPRRLSAWDLRRRRGGPDPRTTIVASGLYACPMAHLDESTCDVCVDQQFVTGAVLIDVGLGENVRLGVDDIPDRVDVLFCDLCGAQYLPEERADHPRSKHHVVHDRTTNAATHGLVPMPQEAEEFAFRLGLKNFQIITTRRHRVSGEPLRSAQLLGIDAEGAEDLFVAARHENVLVLPMLARAIRAASLCRESPRPWWVAWLHTAPSAGTPEESLPNLLLRGFGYAPAGVACPFEEP